MGFFLCGISNGMLWGKEIVMLCRVICWLYYVVVGNSRGYFNIVEGCNVFYVVILYVISIFVFKVLILLLS